MDFKLCVLFTLAAYKVDVAFSQLVITQKFALTVQGKGQCPDPSYEGSSDVIPARSQLDCARRCSGLDDCIYHGYRNNEKLCHLYTSTPDRLLPTPDCKFMMKPEAFQGLFPPATVRIDPDGCSLPFQYSNKEFNKCINVTGMATPQCVTPSGTLTTCIAPPGFIVKQDVFNMTMGILRVPLPYINNWIVMMNRFDGSVNFNRSWAEYKLGFGDIRTSEFWIGNENIHLYTTQPGATYRLRVEVQSEASEKWYYAEYTSFFLDSEKEKYAIHLAGYVGNAGDSLADSSVTSAFYQNGMGFTAYDADNDLMPTENCAKVYSSGWWFNNCWYACLSCEFSKSTDFAWFSLYAKETNQEQILKAARMMIRRNYL